MCVAYMAIASAAAESGERLWILRPKLHVSGQVFHQLVSGPWYVYIHIHSSECSMATVSRLKPQGDAGDQSLGVPG